MASLASTRSGLVRGAAGLLPGAAGLPRGAAGVVRGSGEPITFLGVPYASASRFSPPAPPRRWNGVRDALTPGPAAPQPDRPVAAFTHGSPPATDEDCLNLNVYTPSLEGRRPVMVWLHGGGFAIGHAAASIYDGTALAAAADVVVVAPNYRLGSLGWLCHPELAPRDGAPAGNWGLLDQIAALEWVADNVESFGGDPEQITLAGQSAGALSAMDLVIATEPRRLFQRLILQSPPFADLAAPASLARHWSEALSELAGGGGRFDSQLLRSLSAERVVALHEALLNEPDFRGTRGGALPAIDPGTLPRSPAADPALMSDVEVLIGSTAEEATFFFNSPWRPSPEPERIPGMIAHLPGVADAESTLERYRRRASLLGRPQDELSLLVEIATDAMIATPAADWATQRAGAGGRVYRYRVDHRGAGPRLGATHTVEVPLLFGTWADGGPGERLGGRGTGTAAVASALVDAWTRFMHGDGPGWAPVGGSSERDREIGVFGGDQPFSVEQGESVLTENQYAS